MLIVNWPSMAALWRTVSYLASRELMFSPGFLANANISVMLVNLLSSSSAENLWCNAPIK